MDISFCSTPNSDQLITITVCAQHIICTDMACTKIYSNVMVIGNYDSEVNINFWMKYWQFDTSMLSNVF